MNDQYKAPSFFLSRIVLFTALIALLSACSSDDSSLSTDRDSASDASYKVTFTAAWSLSTFPVNFPSGAHFSGLVGGTHNDQIKFWERGQIATDGIESMAETGSQNDLSSEVSTAKINGTAEFLLVGEGNNATGSVVLELDINQAYPLVTLVSMVAPSPDWFVGVRDLSLFDNATGDWKQTVMVNLAVYDAGSDSGLSFAAANVDTQPAETISLLSSASIDTDFVDGEGPNGEFIATLTFERIK